ncbi:MAG TPA: AMP-binding protein [Burkholderiaceae bacterium]|nr:AMP-binding protein [Burkholderiaceae bacterium]
MTPLLSMGETLSVNASIYPSKIGARDLHRSMTFREWNSRSCRLANALLGLGLAKGDRVAVLAYNCVEWMEIYAACAKAGLVAVPINFRLLGDDILYILENCTARAFIVQDALLANLESIRSGLAIPEKNLVLLGSNAKANGLVGYEDLLARAADTEPDIAVTPDDTWVLMYTSGTTGKPKGAMRSHGSHALLNYATLLDMQFHRDDMCLLVMPMCHANSLNFASAFAYAGATCCVYDARSFDPGHLLQTLSETQASFTSLVPTHYIMMLGLPQEQKNQYRVDSVRKLLVSSAPARRDTKLAIMEYFSNSQLLELYGSTEQGWATLLRPSEQLTKLGSVGREYTGSGRIKLLDENGREVPEGEVGELYSRTPWCFQGYWNLPEKTAEAFRGPYLSVGDMARRDADGFYTLVDRKNNVIISGGENIYPSEVENVLGAHPKIRDIAVVGRPDEKWGEAVHAVVVLRDSGSATESELMQWCASRLAGYKRPKSFSFIADAQMPRTATGKILHRVLKNRL